MPIRPTHELAPLPDSGSASRPPQHLRGSVLSAAELQGVLQQVEIGLEKPLRVRELARQVGLSQFHFSREFRRITGTSPYAYVLQRRIARAALLLAGTHLSINAVAREVGFKRHAHFTNVFTKTVGMTPRAYRVRHGHPRRARGEASLPRAARTAVRAEELVGG